MNPQVAAEELAEIDPLVYRKVLGHFTTGVTVITAMHKRQPVGFSANSFTSVSLDPPLVAFCAGKNSDTWPLIRKAGAFAVNILGADQMHLGRVFSMKDLDRYEGVEWEIAPVTGSPLLVGSIGWIDCRIYAIHDAGDHEMVIGHVLSLESTGNEQPLVFFRGDYGTVALPKSIEDQRKHLL